MISSKILSLLLSAGEEELDSLELESIALLTVNPLVSFDTKRPRPIETGSSCFLLESSKLEIRDLLIMSALGSYLKDCAEFVTRWVNVAMFTRLISHSRRSFN